MKNTKRLYADIAKVTEQADGTIIVSGFASTGSVDSDGETVTPDAMKAALPDYMKFGAVREMHQASAAGTATRAEVNSDGQTEFEAHVVDPVAVKKVQTGVYKGFSIGGKVTERDAGDKNVIKGLKLVEVSLVDRPANPEAIITVFKADRMPEEDVAELADILDKGEITPADVLALIKAAKEEPKADKVKKGLYGVSQFASVLQSIGYLASDAQCEADWEGDSSPIPAQLRDWLKQGAALLQAMTAEETEELVSSLSTQAGELEVMQLAAAGGDLSKAGAKFSAKTKQQLGDIHKAMQDTHAALGDCVEKMAGIGFDAKDDDGSKAAGAEDLAKSAARDEMLQAISKAAGAKDGDDVPAAVEALAKAAAEVEPLRKRIKELEAMPAPGKALLKAIGKGDDVTGQQVEKVEPVVDHQGDINEVATLIKAAHRGVRSTT